MLSGSLQAAGEKVRFPSFLRLSRYFKGEMESSYVDGAIILHCRTVAGKRACREIRAHVDCPVGLLPCLDRVRVCGFRGGSLGQCYLPAGGRMGSGRCPGGLRQLRTSHGAAGPALDGWAHTQAAHAQAVAGASVPAGWCPLPTAPECPGTWLRLSPGE